MLTEEECLKERARKRHGSIRQHQPSHREPCQPTFSKVPFSVPVIRGQTSHHWRMPHGIRPLIQRGILRSWNLAHEPAAWKRLLVDHTDLDPRAYEALTLVAIISLQLTECPMSAYIIPESEHQVEFLSSQVQTSGLQSG